MNAGLEADPRPWPGLNRWLKQPADAAGLAALRMGLGFILCVSAIRFIAKGWVSEIYVAPRFHFTYFGFEWVRPWPEPWMTLHVAAMAVAAILLGVGLFTRFAALVYVLLFTYAELIEKAAYLNHYYLVSILVGFLVFLPSNQAYSLDRKWGLVRTKPVTNAHYELVRAQIAIVYLYAGAAKLNPDWLFHAEPVRTWLRAHSELPVVGNFLGVPFFAFAMSYFGLLYDLTVPIWLLGRKTRALATAVGVAFHLTISFLFPVGIFSYVMLTGLTSFFDPTWPRVMLSRIGLRRSLPPDSGGPTEATSDSSGSKLLASLGWAHLGLQLLLPLRFLLYPGHVNWTEQGFRFAWRVMLIEKAGHTEFQVRRPDTGASYLVFPRDELTPLQRRQMATQADMIHEYALHLADAFRTYPEEPIEVRVHSFVAWNGRPSERFIDPKFDLACLPRSLGPMPFILPSPKITR
jgi:vitamin K-dependent gamma-carboxylase